MNKKLTSALCLLSISCLLIFSGCNNKQSDLTTATDSSSNSAFVIMTSFYPLYTAVQNIAGGIPDVEIANLTSVQSGCLHDYQLSPADMIKLGNASVLVINGAGLESFLNEALQSYPELPLIDASKNLPLLTDPHTDMQNPHIWVSLSGYKQLVDSICQQLSAIDHARASIYRKNCDDYLAKIEALRVKMHTELDLLPHRNIITFHEAFPYFAEEFNLNIVGVVEREPGSEPSAGELAETIDLIRANQVNAIFVEPQYSTKAGETLARETNIKVYQLDPAVSGPLTADAYLDIMEKNLQTLKTALQ